MLGKFLLVVTAVFTAVYWLVYWIHLLTSSDP